MTDTLDFKRLKVYFGDGLVDFDSAKLSVASSAVLYGLSVYSVFAVRKTTDGMAAFRLQDHFNRLLESAKIMGIDDFEKKWDYKKFENAASKLITENNIDQDVFVRCTVHIDELVPGTKSRGLNSILSMFIYPYKSILPEAGARVKTSVWRRVPDNSIPPRAKVNGAYVNSVLGKQDAIDSGYDDCVFLDITGHVCELSAANIFLVKNGVLITPNSTSDLLEGINRKTIIEYAEDQGLEVQQRTVDLTELYIADELFACGTSAWLTPIVEVDGRKIEGGDHEISNKLAKIHLDTLSGNTKYSQKYLTNL
jgi:branched-chain amino acid aminotransferase